MAMQPMRPRQQRRMDNRREIATGGRVQAPQRPMQRPQQPMPGPAPVQVMGQQGMQTPTAGPDAGMQTQPGQLQTERFNDPTFRDRFNQSLLGQGSAWQGFNDMVNRPRPDMGGMPGNRLPISKPGTEMGQNVYRPQGQGIVAGEMDNTSPGRAWGGRPQGPGFAGQFGGGMSGLAQAHPMGDKFNPNVSQNDPAFAQNPQARDQMMQYRQRMLQRQGQPRGLMAQPPKPVIPNSGGGY